MLHDPDTVLVIVFWIFAGPVFLLAALSLAYDRIREL